MISSMISLLVSVAYAGAPLWTFTPLTPTTISINAIDIATVQYTVTNQSRKTHTLSLISVPGISQDTTAGNCPSLFTPPCRLTLNISGSLLQGNIIGGPRVCEHGNPLQCYQPSLADSLNITVTPAPGQTTLSSSITTMPLTLQASGVNRIITITNTGSSLATHVTYTASPLLPAGSTITPATCGNMPALSQCILTIHPGATPSAAPGNLNPTPITLTVNGVNTNILTPQVNIVALGSVYQGGYIYAIDDTTPTTGSIGGKDVTLVDQVPAFPNGKVWAANGNSGTGGNQDVSYDRIPGIDDASTTSVGSPTYPTFAASFAITYTNPNPFNSGLFNACDGLADGVCNTQNILTFYNELITHYDDFGSPPPYTATPGPTTLTTYAAGNCKVSINGYSDWYLPAICEMGNIAFAPCTNPVNTTMNNLVQLGIVTNLTGVYWSSTEDSTDTLQGAWFHDFTGSQFPVFKESPFGVRCSRILTV